MNARIPTTAPDLVRNARQLYQSHRVAARHESKIKNLDLLWQVLEGIRSEGGRDYCLAEVGRRLESCGGPRTQSLRNAQGAHFREVVSAYAEAAGGSTRYVAQDRSQVDAALDLITDPSIRATLRMAIEEGKRLKVVNDNLHAAFKTLQLGASIMPVPPAAEPCIAAAVPAGETLSPRLRRALHKGVEPTRLAERGLSVQDDGSIHSEAGETLFPPGFVTAVRAVLQT
jgi:hypothetical protein